MDVITLGRATVDLFANEFNIPLEEVKTFTKYVGGCPANIATACAQLGLATGIITKVGSDACGRYVKKYLESKNIDTSNVFFDKNRRTGLALGEISPPDSCKILFYRENPADLNLSMDDIDKNYIHQAKILIVSGTALSKSPSREAGLMAMSHAARGNVKIIVDIDYRDGTWDSQKTAFYYLDLAMQKADIVIGTKDEVALATNFCENYNNDIIKKYGLDMLIVKNGPEGAAAYTGDDVCKVPAYNVKVLNTIGAGDGFCAGLVYSLFKQFPLKKALQYANAVGGISVSRQSCSDSYPSLNELEAFINEKNNLNI